MRRTHSRPPAAREARAAFQPLERRVLFAAGDLDTTFGGDGLVHGNPAEFAGRIAAIAVQSDGKTVAVGSSTPAQTFGVRAAVLRYNADGSFDTTFGGGDGIVLFDRFEGRTDFSRLTDVEILPNGDIVAAGTATEAQPDGTAKAYNIAVRLNSAGAGVPTFGESALAAVSTAGGTFLRQRVALDALPSGEVFIAGQAQVNTPGGSGSARAAVIKLTAAGTLDTTFGSAEHPGMWRQPVDDSRSDFAGARDVQVQPDGRVLVAGDVDDRREAFVVRLTPNGAEDASFGGGDGTVLLDYGAPANRRTEVTGNAIALQGDGKIVLAWSFNNAGGSRTLSFRYANGSSDRPLELRVNGQVINPRLSFAPTGSWNTWREVSVTVDLSAGNNRVKLTSVGRNGGNIDALTVR